MSSDDRTPERDGSRAATTINTTQEETMSDRITMTAGPDAIVTLEQEDIDSMAERAIAELLEVVERLRNRESDAQPRRLIALEKALTWIAATAPENDGGWARWAREELAMRGEPISTISPAQETKT